MRFEYAHLCDYALLSDDGKQSIIGIFNRITFAALPGLHSVAYLAFRLEFDNEAEMTPTPIRVQMLSPSGERTLELAGRINPRAPEPGEALTGVGSVVVFRNFEFQEEGVHIIRLTLGEPVSQTLDVPLKVTVGRPEAQAD